MSKSLAKVDSSLPDFRGRVADIKNRIKGIQLGLKELLKEGTHYGVIPGTQNKTLYKPGAEMLMALFNLKPTFEVVTEWIGDHASVTVTCSLYRVSGEDRVFMGSGVGACTTMENKYRYRDYEAKAVGSVPKAYWDLFNKRKDSKSEGEKKALTAKMKEVIGPNRGVKKIDDQWQIIEKGEKIENLNPADLLNTVVKIAKKRANVDAVISTIGGSDMFTQDFGDPETDDDKEQNDAQDRPETPPPA